MVLSSLSCFSTGYFSHFGSHVPIRRGTWPALASGAARKSAGHVDLLQSAAAAAAGRLDLGLTFLGAFMGRKDGTTGSEIWEFYSGKDWR